MVGGAVAGEVRSVVELFTSQGCSSCPPADALLAEYAGHDDILALSFNVDYWDYLGWKDTLATPDNTERQRAYASARGDGQVYTPQAVIDGRAHVIGSKRDAIEAELTRNAGALSVPMSLTKGADAITVTVGAAPAADTPHATLWLVMYDRSVTVPIGRGENQGRTITYSNVVRKLRPIEMWRGDPMSVELPRSELALAKVRRCAVLLQAETAEGLPGPVIGAAMLDMGR
jgi:hypothetical protein